MPEMIIQALPEREDMTPEERIAALEQEIRLLEADRRDLYFAHILGSGYYSDEETLLSDGAERGVDFPYPLFVVVQARIEEWGELFDGRQMDRKDMKFVLRNAMEYAFPGKTHAADIKNRMTAVVNLRELPSLGVRGLVQDARSMLEILEDEFGLSLTVSISRVYHSPLELNRAMQDAEYVLEYIDLLCEDRPVTAYEDLLYTALGDAGISYLDLETKVLGCARVSDFAGIRSALHQLISGQFGTAKPSISTYRFRVYGVVNTLLYLMDDIRVYVGNEVVDAINPGPRLTETQNLTEIMETIDDIMDQLESYRTQKRQNEPPKWVAQVRQYVLENFRDPDTTVSIVADRFGITPTYCSKLFRQEYDVRLFDFIQLQRLNAAKELLSTDKPLSEIAMEVGFSNALAMSRAFKRCEGTAPSKLREQQK